MKKFFLFLATLMLGFGQLFADEVTFSVSDLKATLPASNTNISLPYEWKPSPYHVTATIAKTDGTEATLGVSTVIALNASYKITVSVAGAGSVDGVKFTTNPASQNVNATASTGSFESGTWTPDQNKKTNTVTFTCTSNFRLTQIYVDYTPDKTVNPDVPKPTGDPLVGPFEATPIKSIATYDGTDPYVFDESTRKYYAYNNLNQYEEFGLYPEVRTLKVAGGGISEIEYIATLESVGAHPYINTNYIPKANTKIVLDAEIANSTQKGWMAVFGARQGGWTSHAFVLFARAWDNQKGCYNRTGDEHAGDSDIPRDQRMTIEALGKTCTFTLAGQTDPALTITTKEESTVEDCTNHLFLFDTNTGGANEDRRDNSYVYMKLYGCKIYEGETLVRDYVPIVDSEGNGGLKDKVSGEIVYSASSENFELSADGQAIAGESGISVYPGKLVINTSDQHEYNWNGTEWVDLGSVYKPIADTNYQNMNNWTCRFGFASTYDNIENTNGNYNFFNPYRGEGGWEPYQVKITGLTKGETYRLSFNFTSEGWTSWDNGRWAALPVFVTNNWDFPQNDFYPTSVGGQVLGLTTLPKAAVTNQPYSFTFTADGTEVTLGINFGVVNDGTDYHFNFDNLNIEFVDYPQKYAIDWTDPNKYTPLAYIESTGAARENVFTTPYYFKASSEIDTKFQSYGNGGWRAIFCGRNGSDSGISLYQNGNGADFGYFVGGYVNDNHAPYPGHNQDITVAASLGNLNVNGTDYSTGREGFNASTNQISLFANPGNDNPFRGRIYYFTIKEGDETVYDFQPVMRHDGAFGYYDKATKTFLTPVRGNWDGYGFGKLEDQSYLTYNKETRIVVVGSTAQFLPDAQNLDGATYTWTSSDESKATVAADGTVTGKAAGKVTITVTTDADQGWTASYELTVSEPNYVRRDANGVGYAIVTGGNGWGDSPLSALIDNDARTKFGCSGTGDAWAIIIASEPVAVQQYSFVTGGDTYNYPERNPRSWKLEGSNDNQNWTVIDERSDYDAYRIHAVNKEEFVIPVNGTETYKFFKFSAAVVNGFQLSELWINAQAHDFAENNELRVDATCTKQGKVVYECNDCHALISKPIEMLPHTYENGVCTACSAKISEPTLLANGQTDSYAIKFRHKAGEENDVEIEAGWNTPNFDDSAWDELMMPIGTNGYNDGNRKGAQVNTIWFNEYNTYWFRRPFYVDDPSTISKLTVKALHDDDFMIFINGTKIAEEPGWTDGTDWCEYNADPALLVAGENVVAIYIEQNWGGAYCDFSLEAQVAAPIAVGETGYATFVAPFDVDFTGANVTAHAATLNGEYIKLSDAVTKVPAGAAVIVKADEGTYRVPVTTDAVNNVANELVASDGITADGTQYILAQLDNKVGFAKATPASVIPAGKGYIVISSGQEVKAFYPFFGDDETAISDVNANGNANDAAIYNMAGQRVSKLQKGVNIVNGKKILK